MIAQIIFDLPLEGPFDYLIPEELVSKISVGSRVNVSFGHKNQIGYVIGLIKESIIAKLKPITSLRDPFEVFNELDLNFARDFSAYYGCSLGEALATLLRNRIDYKPTISRAHKPVHSLFRCHPHEYAKQIQEIIERYGPTKESRFLILVPDTFQSETLSSQLKKSSYIKIGMRSSVFECDGRYECVLMIDDDNSSFKQEQSPMYETRQVLLVRSAMYNFDIAFIGISPSVELMALVDEKKIKLIEKSENTYPKARLVDLTQYKYVPGLLSPPVRDALDAALKSKKKSILVLNRRGSYRITRCVDCLEILKCSHCDSPLIYSRKEEKFLCRHCTFSTAGETVCPKCHKPNWRSYGIGVEQVQTEIRKLFPNAKIESFEGASQTLGEFDILISTQAVLRFQGRWQVHMVAFIDFDAELNRLEIRSAFNAFSLVLHVSCMALETVFIQTRNLSHYALGSLSQGKVLSFYDEELKLRKELGFSPFRHWIKISWRGKTEKSIQEAASQVYNVLNQKAGQEVSVTPPLVDTVGRKRDQFRFNVMVQANQVVQSVALIKSTLEQVKRPSKVIVTLNIDP